MLVSGLLPQNMTWFSSVSILEPLVGELTNDTNGYHYFKFSIPESLLDRPFIGFCYGRFSFDQAPTNMIHLSAVRSNNYKSGLAVYLSKECVSQYGLTTYSGFTLSMLLVSNHFDINCKYIFISYYSQSISLYSVSSSLNMFVLRF